MRLTKTLFIFLGAAILIAAGITLYMFYQGQMSEQDKLNESLTAAHTTLTLLGIEKGALEDKIAQLESDLAELEGETGELEAEISRLEDELGRLEDERAQAVAQAILLLSQAEAKFQSSVESIEYDEILFGFAHDANLRMTKIEASEPVAENVEDIAYNTTTFNVTVWGDVDDILDFVDTVVAYEAFKTSVLDTFSMNVPELLTDEEIAELEETIRAQLTAEAIAEITTEEMVGIIVEAIAEVTGPESDWPDEVETMTVEEMAQMLEERIDELVETGFVDLLAGDLAELIEEHIEGAIVGEIVKPLAERIAALILSGDEDLAELLGVDIAELLGENIAGSLSGDIVGLLNEYISNLVEEKMTGSVEGIVEAMTDTVVAEMVEEMEVPSSDITLVIYTYEGG